MLAKPRSVAAIGFVIAALLALAAAASAYTKPPGGAWKVDDLFEYTDGGAMSLSKDGGKLAKLALTSGERGGDACGSKVRVISKPKVKRFKRANGRWAIGRQPRQLIDPVTVKLKVDGKRRSGKLLMLFDENGRLATTAKVEFADCRLEFIARKRR